MSETADLKDSVELELDEEDEDDEELEKELEVDFLVGLVELEGDGGELLASVSTILRFRDLVTLTVMM